MNDLAQQALRTAGAARARVSARLTDHPVAALALGGFVAGSVAVVAGGRVGTVKTTIPLTDWLGLLSRDGVRSGYYLPGTLELVGIAALVLLWLVAFRVARSGRFSEPAVWSMAGAWSIPFVVGPPLMSSDVYTYAAQGLMVRLGFDPYTSGPSVLGNVAAMNAVDPRWRSVPSPYGPLATTVQHLAIAVSGGSPLGAVLVLRGLAVASVVAIGLLAAALAGPRRVAALMLTVLNPLILLQVVSAAHLEGVMCALLLGALVAADRGRWSVAIVLAIGAAAVKAPALVAVAAIVVVHGFDRRGRPRWAILARDVATAAVSFGALTVLVPNGLGWTHALSTPALSDTPFAPSSAIAQLFAPVVQVASYDDRATAGRITTLLAAGCIVGYLLLTAQRRSLNRTVGYGLLAVGLLGPVVYPWYLLWGLVCLTPTARAPYTRWLVLASATACFISPTGFTHGFTNGLSIAALVVAGYLAVRMLRTPAASPEPVAPPAPAETATATR